jgi:hypothetical protein
MLLDPRFAGSHPAEDSGFLRAMKILSTPSYGEEVKPLAQCLRIFLLLVKEPFVALKRCLVGLSQSYLHSPVPLALLLDDSADMIAKDLWWKNQSSTCRYNSTIVLHVHIPPREEL